MSSIQQTNRFMSFANGGQRQQGLPSQGVFPQSLSGSETDVSTSNENLSNEERYVIRHTARQEPQGQENLQSSNRSSLKDSLPSNRSSLDVSSSSYNTLIIHSAGDESWTGRLSGIRDHSDYASSPSNSLIYCDTKLPPSHSKRNSNSPSPSVGSAGNGRMYDPAGMQEITDIPDDYLSQSHVLKHLAKEVKVPSSNTSSVLRDSGVSENADVDRLSLTRKDSNPESHMKYDINKLPPPPEYPKWINKSPVQAVISRQKKDNEKLILSRSQPDLSKVEVEKMGGDLVSFRRGVSAPRPPTKGREDMDSSSELWPSAEMVEILIKENSNLKMELENCYQKVAKTQKLEQEIAKVHRAQEELVESCERRERLERTARSRLQADCRRLQELNRALREQVESLQLLSLRTPTCDLPGTEGLRRELNKREVLIAQLISQNKELAAAKERQEIELAAQRATLQEQRTHIDILDTALTNAQGNVVRLEEECRKKQMYVERVAQLQRALSSLQLASDRREQTERKLRQQLERELRNERAKGPGGDNTNDGVWSPNDHPSGETNSELKRRLRERDEKIMRLEGDCAKWEQRYLEESALRQAAIDAASIPKDAKIAALEKTSQETEKLIAEARNEKIRHMDEVHAAQKKVADLESRVKDLESKLAERDAMIRVLQKHTYDKDVSSSSSYPSMLGRSPHHTPHPSLHGNPDLDTVLGTSVSREELVSSVLTSSTGFGSGNSYTGSDSSYHMPSYSKYESNKNFDSTKKTLDDQLKELDSQLDSQLLSKRALCCFPGFSNPGTASRKGKIPKPLLAGVTAAAAAAGGGLFEPGGFLQTLVPPARTESGEMLLLEKQGRTSQQQRMQEAPGQQAANGGSSGPEGVDASSRGRHRSGSLPPSSLPRPPKSSHRSGLPRRFGEYGRLGDGDVQPRKKSDGGDSLSSNGSSTKQRPSPARSLIPPPRKFGEYGRLTESESRNSLRKSSSRGLATTTSSVSDRNSASTLSDNSATSLPPPSKLRMFATPSARRGSSLGRDNKASPESSSNKYRIQF